MNDRVQHRRTSYLFCFSKRPLWLWPLTRKVGAARLLRDRQGAWWGDGAHLPWRGREGRGYPDCAGPGPPRGSGALPAANAKCGARLALGCTVQVHDARLNGLKHGAAGSPLAQRHGRGRQPATLPRAQRRASPAAGPECKRWPLPFRHSWAACSCCTGGGPLPYKVRLRGLRLPRLLLGTAGTQSWPLAGFRESCRLGARLGRTRLQCSSAAEWSGAFAAMALQARSCCVVGLRRFEPRALAEAGTGCCDCRGPAMRTENVRPHSFARSLSPTVRLTGGVVIKPAERQTNDVQRRCVRTISGEGRSPARPPRQADSTRQQEHNKFETHL